MADVRDLCCTPARSMQPFVLSSSSQSWPCPNSKGSRRLLISSLTPLITMDILSDEIESVLFVGKEVLGMLLPLIVLNRLTWLIRSTLPRYSVYRVPPRTSNEGYKAAEWNGQGVLWKGRIRIMEKGTKCEIRLEDPNTGEQCCVVLSVRKLMSSRRAGQVSSSR